MKLTNIDIKLIIPNKEQPRQKMKNIQQLATNIKKNGLINPVSVEKIGEKKYKIISGERRYHAIKYLRMPKVPCIIKKKTKYEMLAENFCREDLNIMEKAQAIHLLLTAEFGGDYRKDLIQLKNKDPTEYSEKSKKLQETCSAIGYSPEYIYQTTKVLTLNKRIQQEIIKHNVGSAVTIKLSMIRNPEIQKKIFKLIERGENDAKIIREINREQFLQSQQATVKIEKARELFLAYQNFNRGTSHLTSAIPLLIGLVENLPKTKKAILIKNTSALIYLMEKLESKDFLKAVTNIRKKLEELQQEI